MKNSHYFDEIGKLVRLEALLPVSKELATLEVALKTDQGIDKALQSLIDAINQMPDDQKRSVEKYLGVDNLLRFFLKNRQLVNTHLIN